MWTSNQESELLKLRESGKTYSELAELTGRTISSVKHKIRRIQQARNDDRYKHTMQKTAIAEKYISESGLNVLETHCGYGGMTRWYAEQGSIVECYDIDRGKVDGVNLLGYQNVQAIKGDSEKEIIRLFANQCKYDAIDLDPYGLPSRYFPYVFSMIESGLLFVTFPMLGVAQMNKITIQHYKSFWGFCNQSGDDYIETIKARMKDYAFMFSRDVEFLEVVKIDRIYRMVLRVEKKSMCDIVGLVVNRAVK
jgi:hypothetical protein